MQLKYDDSQGDDNGVLVDEGALCCQGASVLLLEKLINWLRCVLADRVFTACLCASGLLNGLLIIQFIER